MIQKLQRRLTLLFTGATCLILTLTLGVTCFYQFTQSRSKASSSFQNQLLDLTNKLELDENFSDDWLARLEHTGRLIIHIEENGVPLFFTGSWTPDTDRDTLIQLAKDTALTRQVDTAKRPFSYSMEKTVFSLKGKKQDTYQAAVVVLSLDKGYRSMVLLADTTKQTRTALLQVLFFLALEFWGVLALYLVSRYVVERAVKPVKEYHQKQTDFVAAASHELRSPLAVIQASASAITAMPEQGPKMAKAIVQECARAGKLIKNLLLLASADSESLAAQMEPVEADDLLLRLFEAYEPLCKDKQILLKLKLPEDFLPQVSGNPLWIYQIVSIFLDNAISYGCSEESEIIIQADLLGKEAAISVCDHGPGIPEQTKERIFDRFYQADSSRSEKEHFGLGLCIADTLAKQMKARVSIKDTKGGGATFCLFLNVIDICH